MLRICSVLVLIVAASFAHAGVQGVARVVDGDTLHVMGETVRLFGIDAPERAQSCAGPDGDWPCGRWASRHLQGLIAGGVSCDDRGRDRYGRMISVCHRLNDGAAINADMVLAGAAVAFRRYSMDYVSAEETARQNGRGMWVMGSDAVVRPHQFRAARWMSASTDPAAPACAIKGNISANGRIYHLPGQRDYARTRINEAQGERWFCSEAAAQAAGWRRAAR